MKKEKGEASPLVEGTKPFHLTLAELEHGQLVDDLADELRTVNAVLSEHQAQTGRAKGTLTLTLKIVHDGGVVEIEGEIKSKVPKLAREKTIRWLSPGNNLVGEDPKQLRMDLRRVPKDEAPIRDIPETKTKGA